MRPRAHYVSTILCLGFFGNMKSNKISAADATRIKPRNRWHPTVKSQDLPEDLAHHRDNRS
jgi:hypothetical protein